MLQRHKKSKDLIGSLSVYKARHSDHSGNLLGVLEANLG